MPLPPTDYYIQGLQALIDGQHVLAKELLSKAVEDNSDLVDAYYQLANLFIRQNEVLRGQKILRDLLLRKTLDEEFRQRVEVKLIEAYTLSHNFPQAQILAERRLNKNPKNMNIKKSLVSLLEKQRHFEAAEVHLKEYSRWAKVPPKPKLALYKVEKVRADKAMPFKSRRTILSQAIRLDPECAPAYMLMARLFKEQKKQQKVLEYWELLLENTPEKAPWIFSEMEKYLYEEKEYDRLLRIYQKLSGIEGEHQGPTYLALSKYYFKIGKFDLARKTLLEFNEINKDSIHLLNDLIQIVLNKNSDSQLSNTIYDILIGYFENKPFKCDNCGFISNHPEWHCLQCGSWNSFK